MTGETIQDAREQIQAGDYFRARLILRKLKTDDALELASFIDVLEFIEAEQSGRAITMLDYIIPKLETKTSTHALLDQTRRALHAKAYEDAYQLMLQVMEIHPGEFSPQVHEQLPAKTATDQPQPDVPTKPTTLKAIFVTWRGFSAALILVLSAIVVLSGTWIIEGLIVMVLASIIMIHAYRVWKSMQTD